MDLKGFLSEYPNLELLTTAKQNEEILALMDRSPMKVGGLELLYDRSPSFERLLRCQGTKYFTLLARNSEGQLMGIFSLSVLSKYIQGQKMNCAYIGDFRTDGSRQAAHLWRKEYARLLEILKKEKSIGEPQYFLTAVLKKNMAALRSLASKRAKYGFYYHQLKEVNMINVLSSSFWSPIEQIKNLAKNPLKVERAKVSDLKALKFFLNEREKANQFGAIFDGSDNEVWSLREKEWSEFKIENFLVIKDSLGQIKACTLPWDPSFAKKMSVRKAPYGMQFILKILKKLDFNIPLVGQYLQTIYLTHLHWNESLKGEEVLRAFIKETQGRFPQAHMISFADDRVIGEKLSGFLLQKTPVLLFEVSSSPEASFPVNSSISFEMGLV